MHFSKLLAGLALASTSAFAQGVLTSESSYLSATPTSDFTFTPIVTVGDRVPLTSGTGPVGATDYTFCGIPDAMGIYKDSVTNENILFVAHEINSTSNSRPFAGSTRYKGAFVSRFSMNSTTGAILNGTVAHKELFLENTQAAGTLGTRPPLEGDTAGFTRFCSGSFAGREHGMDRPLYFTNEESGTGNYNANGSQVVVVADGKMYTIPAMGRAARETTIVQPRRDDKTVVIFTEDGPAPSASPVSYTYMYVGTKLRRSNSVLDKNGLTGGKLYVLCGNAAQHNEGTFTSGSLATKWVEIPNAANLTGTQLSIQADVVGGFGLVRVEDAEFDPTQPTRSVFLATTGGSGPNRLGRLYELTMNPVNPLANGTLNIVYNADTIIYPAGSYSGASTGRLTAPVTGAIGTYTQGDLTGPDYPVSIDNIAVTKDFIVVCEDTNSPANAVYTAKARNAGMWTLNRNNAYAAKLQSTFNYGYVAGRDGNLTSAYSAGLWESSGVISTDAIFGAGTFLINIQAHPYAAAAHRSNAPNGSGGFLTKAQALLEFAEDGQVLLVRPKP